MRKRLLAILLTLGMALALLPTSALAYIGAMGESEVYTQTYADNDFIYLENSSLRFMIERDYGHGMLLWTSDRSSAGVRAYRRCALPSSTLTRKSGR